jgi:predicted HTH transcriptional regulator
MIRRKDLLQLIEEGENGHCEFKRKFSSPEKIAREIMAFANTRGGYILFGIDDNRQVVGVESEKSEAELISDAASNHIEPPVKINIQYININEKEIVVVEVPESDKKPHRLQDYQENFDITKAVVCIRVNDKSVQASKEMMRIMRAQSDNLELKKYVLGNDEKSVFSFLENNEKITVKDLSNFINISERRASRTLVKMVRANLLAIHIKDNGDEFFTSL